MLCQLPVASLFMDAFGAQEFCCAARIAGEAGQGAAHGFDEGAGEALVAAGLDIDIHLIQPLQDRFAAAYGGVECDFIRQAVFTDEGLPALRVAVAQNVTMKILSVFMEDGEGFDGDVDAFELIAVVADQADSRRGCGFDFFAAGFENAFIRRGDFDIGGRSGDGLAWVAFLQEITGDVEDLIRVTDHVAGAEIFDRRVEFSG